MTYDYTLKLKPKDFVLNNTFNHLNAESEVKNGKYLKCSGYSYFQIDKGLITNDKEFLIEFWAKIPVFATETAVAIVYAQGDLAANTLFAIGFVGIFGFKVFLIIVNGDLYGIFNLPEDDQFYHAIFAYDKVNVNVLVNGHSVLSSEVEGGLPYLGNTSIIGGFDVEIFKLLLNNPSVVMFPVELDEMKIYKGKGKLEAGYHFEEANESAQIIDFSGNDNHMDLVIGGALPRAERIERGLATIKPFYKLTTIKL